MPQLRTPASLDLLARTHHRPSPEDGTPPPDSSRYLRSPLRHGADRQTLRLPGPAAFNGSRPRSGGSGRRCRSRSRLTGNGVGGAAAPGRALGAAGRLRGRGAGGLAGGPCPPPVPPLAPAPPAAPSRRRPGAAGGGLRRGERSSVRPRSRSASFPALAQRAWEVNTTLRLSPPAALASVDVG